MLTPPSNYYHRFGNNLAAHLSGLLESELVERAASVIERITYWLNNEKSGYTTRDGHKWIVNSYRKWSQQFTWLRPHQIGYIVRKLEAIGLLISARYHELVRIGFRGRSPQMHPDDQSKFYRVNWEMMKSFEKPPQWLIELSDEESEPDILDNNRLEPLPRAIVHDVYNATYTNERCLQTDPNIQKNNNSVVVFEEFGHSEREKTNTEEPLTVLSAEVIQKLRNFGITLSTEPEAIGEDKSFAPSPNSSLKNELPIPDRPNVEAGKLAREAEAEGVKMTPSLMELMASAAANVVRDAIAALKEAQRRNTVKNPAGYLTNAIKGQWRPNSDMSAVAEMETFKQWFPIARERGIATSSMRQDDRLMICVNYEDWIPFSEMLQKYPLSEFMDN
jgi:hypothetical protein